MLCRRIGTVVVAAAFVVGIGSPAFGDEFDADVATSAEAAAVDAVYAEQEDGKANLVYLHEMAEADPSWADSYEKSAASYQAKWGTEALPSTEAPHPDAPEDVDPGTGGKCSSCRFINISHIEQKKSFFCGPGAAVMILNKFGRQSYRDERITQDNLAKFRWLNTENLGHTPWSRDKVAPTLNSWHDDTRSGWYTAKNSPGKDRLRRGVKYNIRQGHPVTPDTVSHPGGVHLKGHPSDRIIGHWTTVYGFSGSGSEIHIADPAGQAAAVSWGPNVSRFYQMPLWKMVDLLEDNGIVW